MDNIYTRDPEVIYQTPNAVMQQAQKELIGSKGQDIHGKDYKTVAIRVYVFRKYFSNYSLITRILEKTDDQVSMIAEIYTPANRLIATGHASAIGRALASFGLAGDEMASANEIERAKAKQKAKQES